MRQKKILGQGRVNPTMEKLCPFAKELLVAGFPVDSSYHPT